MLSHVTIVPGQNSTAPTNMNALTMHLPFVGFTYTLGSNLSDNPPLAREGDSSLGMLDCELFSDIQCNYVALSLPLPLSLSLSLSLPPGLSVELDHLQEEVKTWRGKAEALKKELTSVKEQESACWIVLCLGRDDAGCFPAGMSARMKTLERSSRSLKTVQDDMARLQDSLTAKDKELKAARSAYRDSQDEITAITDK